MWHYILYWLDWFIVFNATFNSISVTSWRSVLLVEETGVPGENHQPVARHWQTLSHNVVSNTPRNEWGSNSQRYRWYTLIALQVIWFSSTKHSWFMYLLVYKFVIVAQFNNGWLQTVGNLYLNPEYWKVETITALSKHNWYYFISVYDRKYISLT
jgi:hypothetical protein